MLVECNKKFVMIDEEMKSADDMPGDCLEVNDPIETSEKGKKTKKPHYSCHRCQKIVKNLADHMSAVHSHEPLEFKCHYCPNKIYEKLTTLQTHYYSHHYPQRNIVCDACGKRFRRKCLLQEHIESEHYGVKKFVCDICHTRFKAKYGLKLHLRSHTKERPHKCQFCDKVRLNLFHL